MLTIHRGYRSDILGICQALPPPRFSVPLPSWNPLLETSLFLSSPSLLPAFQLPSMAGLFYILLSPILLFISIPLSLFATLTTTLAFSTLFFRALLVYAELGAVLIQNQFASQHLHEKALVPTKMTSVFAEGNQPRHKSRRSSAGSGSTGGSTTPRVQDTGFGIYSGGGVVRDFEGVGGWRVPGTDDENAMWTSLNSRLELPAMVDGRRRNHHRSRTSGSLTNVSLPLKSPVRSRARTPTSVRIGGSASLEEYFANRALSKSTTAVDAANIGKAFLHHKPLDSPSGSSQGSTGMSIDQHKFCVSNVY